MSAALTRSEPLAVLLSEGGGFWDAPPSHDQNAAFKAAQRPAAEAALRQIARFAQLVGQKGLAVTLTRDELARALAARSDATLRALTSDLACFARYCRLEGLIGLPAAHESVARYVERLWQIGPVAAADGTGQGPLRLPRPVKPASITRRLASIAMLHRLLHLDNPCREANVRHALTIARKSVGVRQKQAAPIRLAAARQSAEESGAEGFSLEALLDGCDDSLGGLRDAALISTAYDGGFRVSELIAMRVGDLRWAKADDPAAAGDVTLPRSKTDQQGNGALVPLSPDTMRRLRAWTLASGIEEEVDAPLLRRIQTLVRKGNKGRRALDYHELAPNAAFSVGRLKAIPPRAAEVWYEVGEGPLSPSGVNMILRRAARRAADMGLVDLSGEALETAIKALSSHSTRVGLTQDLLVSGAATWATANALRWRDPKTALRYARNLPEHENAAAELVRRLRG